jgi:hypothetical protein
LTDLGSLDLLLLLGRLVLGSKEFGEETLALRLGLLDLLLLISAIDNSKLTLIATFFSSFLASVSVVVSAGFDSSAAVSATGSSTVAWVPST